MTFIYGGEELFRTKKGIDNSYQSPDSINIIPWENKEKYDLWEYYREIIAIRHDHKGFRLGSAELVKKHCEFMPTDNKHLIIYRIKDLEGIDFAKSLVVLLNGGAEPATVEVPKADYTVLAHDGDANNNLGLGVIHAKSVVVEPYSATILAEYVLTEAE